MRITKSNVDKIESPTDKDQAFYRDDQLKGFAVRVTASGIKSFVVEKLVNHKVRRITLELVNKVVDYFIQLACNGEKSKNGIVKDMRRTHEKTMEKIYDNKVLGPLLEKNGVSKSVLMKICNAEYIKAVQPQMKQVVIKQQQPAVEASSVSMQRRVPKK